MRTVDNLADVFRATNVEQLLKNFGKSTQTQDPIIHFYETFLAEYDPKLRKSRGVWYTPEPVVNFIVRAVDDILKLEFDLPTGLADTSKTTIKIDTSIPDKTSKSGYRQAETEVHKVQILDPATGTGTFLAEVVKFIYDKNFKALQGAWSSYVDEHLIPRLNGFELLMASYAMAHLKLDLLLKETGYKSTKNQRFNIYLTNSLEEHHPDTGTLLSQWLSTEANEANHIKRDTPVMVVIGNPPYSGESANKGPWITNLMEDYKKEPGGKEKLNERNPKWINDDYVKFLRYGQYYIEKNGEGILAYINPHGFLDNPTFRGMRWNLLKTYDKIYTIDLHGNSKKKEISPDGTSDVNVFDIMQGVSINIFVKSGKKSNNELGKVYHFDLYGKRERKYEFLRNNNLNSFTFIELNPTNPNFFFVKKDFEVQKKYDKGFQVSKLFIKNSAGIFTARDSFTIKNTKNELVSLINDFVNLEIEAARLKYSLGKDVRDWKVKFAQDDLQKSNLSNFNILKLSYRLFDDKWTYYTGKSKGFHCMPRGDIMQHFLKGNNYGLTLCRQFKSGNTYQHIFITSKIIESSFVSNKTSEITSVFPLYIYPTSEKFGIFTDNDRKPNLNEEIVNQIAEKLGLKFTHEKEETEYTFAPIDILDYIYAALHSPTYREKYKEFLKIEFPRVPFPNDKKTFWKLVSFGRELRQIHLLESPLVEKYITQYPIDGDNAITKVKFEEYYEFIEDKSIINTNHEFPMGKVYINETQFFHAVPRIAWDFYIGGYQPAQKWLKDRTGRKLKFEDILHYQKIIVALSETDKIMKEIDVVGVC